MSLRQKKAEKKKEEIIQSALSIISEKGYHATTMEDIAAKLLMTKGSVYYYFKDKQDLVYKSQKMLLEQSISNIEEILIEDLPIVEKLEKTMVVHIEYLITERTGFTMGARPEQIFKDDQLIDILDLRAKYSKYIDSLITLGIESGYFHKVDVKIVRNIILGAMNYVIEWYSPEGSKNKEELAKSISDYLLRILIKDPK
ncbi:TetR/AcrR family transcriptional regulator [Oceanobacillus piezotolerans]|uniref:TetR/AcrR family transcriptional regulator n=1 Tax=Oceanobacillus piezotolerans TaxID=2448030 RepID=A0A498DQU9_9BACI|nr:TetR/AcrR family transcriptional regulator [Oceanobacillus piezotolerans]RLL46849.1 TetR/AcrR family transcriptional regulator [Oceanobacillus piezotolerans]